MDNISHKVHPTAHVEVPAGTVGEFVTNYLAKMVVELISLEKICQRQCPILVLFYQAWGSGFLFIGNFLAHVEWGVRPGDGGSTTLTALRLLHVALPSVPVLITFCGVLLIHAPPVAASTKTSFVAGVKSIYGANIIGTTPWSLPGFIRGGKTWMVR